MENNILSNKIKYVIIPIKKKDIVSIKFVFQCGFYNEYRGINNYTHLLEHLLAYYFNKKQCTVKKVKKLLSKKIYMTNANTQDEIMCIFIKCYQKDIDFFIKLLSRTIFNLCITKKNLDLSKKHVIQELKQYEDYHIINAINKYIYQRNNVDIKDGINDVEKCTLEDINNFYKNIFSKNMILGINCNKKYIIKNKKLIIKHFSKKIKIEKNIYPINFNTKILKNNKIYKIHKDIKSTEINIIIPFNIQKYTKKYWELIIILNYLFDFEIGPFYEKLRNNKQIIYSITYFLNYCDNDSKKTLLHIKSYCQENNLNIFFKMFDKILKTFNIDNNLFKQAKKKLLFEKKINYMNNIDDCLDYNMYNLLYNRKISHKNNMNNLENAKKNLNLIKELKNTKYYVILLNKKFKKI